MKFHAYYLHYLLATLIALVPGFAQAAEFTVSPIRLDLSGTARSQLLAITNVGTKPARFLVRSAGWTITEANAVELSEDDRLVVFPASFTVAPKATQNIRVGTEQASSETEQTWRVVLEELPDANSAGSAGATINVLSVLSVPVFLAPLTARKTLDIALQDAKSSTARVLLSNTGNAHAMIAAVSVTAMRGADIAVQAQQEGWYLLPGKRRLFTIASDKVWCSPGVTSIEVRAADRDGQVLARQTIDAREACR